MMICQLTSQHECPGRREAEHFIRWTMAYDPEPEVCTSVLCSPCLDGRPPFVRVLEQRPVQDGDRTSA